MASFIVDCPLCKATVAAEIAGIAKHNYFDEFAGEPSGEKLYVGKCPRCSTLIAGYSRMVQCARSEHDEEVWSEVERVFPNPKRQFTSFNIPQTVTQSLSEAEKSMQAGATLAACVMFGRTLEAVCRDKLADPKDTKSKPVMLGKGIRELKARNIIDQRLFDWSEQLQSHRNFAAHPEEGTISREDALDLQAFVNAIVEYIYDLADRYEEFQERAANRAKKKSS